MKFFVEKIMIKLQRLAFWLVEMISQSLILALYMIFIVPGNGSRVTINDIVSIAAINVLYFFITGYAITTAIARIFWGDHPSWSYPAFSAFLFLVHVEAFIWTTGGNFIDRHLRPAFILGGMCIVFFTDCCSAYVVGRRRKKLALRQNSIRN